MTSGQDTAERLWLELLSGHAPSSTAKPAEVRLPRTPRESKAIETTRVARALIDKTTELRQANMARLRQARLSKEAEDRTHAAPAQPKKARKAS